ncbi:MAG TPA: HAD-IA family hydrolase [Solirubrobacteraceae bacterium]|nr:HAD-IA family hydrolase [Solirubrobacteraceae bacterium]
MISAEGALGRGLRVVLLDGLGTLLSLAPPAAELARGLRERYGLRLEAGDAERALAAEIDYYRAHHHEGRDESTLAELRGRCAAVLRAALPEAVAAALDEAQLRGAMLDALRFFAYPEVPATLGALRRRGLELVVVSNWDVSLPAVLADLGLRELLDGVVTSAEVGRPKPDPAIFRAALRLAGASPAQALHVGDSPELDLAGARAAGISAVLLDRSGSHRALGPEAPGVPVIASLADLLA